ncbi:phage tail protein [Elstera cyanobacteriorum]|uniref:Phage tail protein n=1 Tax=Elstera cyanobacteriorum TaxID=2022747 RepID=A0A255XV40_9PROT|nr:phage tail tube protein [Elstera cyanobacteriorum]OYQ20234.1 hypothetical protein CHR90_05865 [Elstera cyanobacteriorum]GFZ80753.1 phage tail protein [Elstera cyanobacteriorum]
MTGFTSATRANGSAGQAFSNRIAGTIYVRVDGEMLWARGAWKVNFARTVREGVAGQDRVHGYTEKPAIPSVEGEVTDRGELSLDKLSQIENATVTVELVNGKTYVLSEAWLVSELSIETEDGKFSVKFEGMDITEQMGA